MKPLSKRLILLAVLLAALVCIPAAGAGTGTFVDITGVETFTCAPDALVWVWLDYGTAPGDVSDHYWTLRNQGSGAATTELIGSVIASGVSGHMSLPVPAGTQNGDVLVMEVRVTSTLGPDTFDSLAFYCDTGELYVPPPTPPPPTPPPSTPEPPTPEPPTPSTPEPPAPPTPQPPAPKPTAPPVFAGPPVPRGFVQTVLTCSTAVFDRPGGEPVGKNAVYAGQAWHLNPTPVEGPDGESWTEVFVAGLHTVYIPTQCVGAPTSY